MAAPRKLDAKTEAKVVKAYVKGDSLNDIKETFGISAGTIRAVVKRADVPLRPVGRPKASA